MGVGMPKQYLPLAGQPLIRHALAALCAVPLIEAVFVVLSADDAAWGSHDWRAFGDRLVVLRCGGASRSETVVNGLEAMGGRVGANDWILVHDAARPCVTPAQVGGLIAAVGDDPVGGLLAKPLADTLKRADAAAHVVATVPREHLWRAQTPQMFRRGALTAALKACPQVTDESSAMEAAGYLPKLVNSDGANPKVTYPEDIFLAELILRSRGH
jgi:2-C-methyl-D-erythritol 4-phosphate cytidylyltransferase